MEYHEERIFNQDQGFEIHDGPAASTFPNNCVGIIYQRMENGPLKVIGTGFLVASDLVLTVAHNVCLREQHKDYKGLLFYPGVSGNIASSIGYKVVQSRHPEQYFTCSDEEKKYFDYALLKIEQKINKQEYLELGLNYQPQKQHLGVIGYRGSACTPKYATQSSVWYPNEHQVVGNILKHRLSTLNGVSGGPLMVRRKDKNIVVGIHFGGFNQEAYNGGRMITDDLLCDLIRWEKEMSSQIKFHLMKNNTSQISVVQIQEKLKSIQRKISVYLAALNQPSFQDLKKQLQKLKLKNKQDKHMQIKEKYLKDIVEKLEAMPLTEKKQITSLTLKYAEEVITL